MDNQTGNEQDTKAIDWRKSFVSLRDGSLPTATLQAADHEPAARCLPETAALAQGSEITKQSLPAPSPEQASMTQHRRNLALLEAAKNSDNSGILSWLGAGADPNCQERAWPGDTPLTLCSKNANSDGVKVLLTHGADPSAPSSSNERALFLAMNKGFSKVASTITSFMSNGLSKDESAAFFDEAITMACKCQDFETARTLIPNESQRPLDPSVTLEFILCFCGSKSRKNSIPDRSACLDMLMERQPSGADRAVTIDSAFSSAFDQDDAELFKNLLRRGFAPSTGWSDDRGTPLVWVAGTRNHGGAVFAAMMEIPEFIEAFKSHLPNPRLMKGLSYKHISKLQSMGGRVTEGRGPTGENIMHVLLAKNAHSFVDLKTEFSEAIRLWPALARTTDSNGKSPFDQMRSSLSSLREMRRPPAEAVVDLLERLAVKLEADALMSFSKKVEREALKSGVKKQRTPPQAASV